LFTAIRNLKYKDMSSLEQEESNDNDEDIEKEDNNDDDFVIIKGKEYLIHGAKTMTILDFKGATHSS